MKDLLTNLKLDLKQLSNPEKAKTLSRFFKTGIGEYGEGDRFLGITVPISREIVRKYNCLSFKNIKILLSSSFHEERLIALLILVDQYKRGDKEERQIIYKFYLSNTHKINNWDLVDLTAPNIVGVHLFDKPRDILYQFARSKNLWERRIAILSTFHFIRQNQFDDTLKISKILLKDSHDLIHKAIGWMLREIGKRDQKTEEKFIIKYYHEIPRTTLRYAIERFKEDKRRRYLEGIVK